VVDFVDRKTLPAVELPELPFTLDLNVPPGVELAGSEIEQIPELLALAQTATPFTRPTFWPYVLGETDATSIEDYLERYSVSGAPPSGAERLYAGYNVDADNRGTSGFMNQFRPQVEKGTFSLIECAVGCPDTLSGTVTEVIGVAISVDKVNAFGWNKQALVDNEPRVHVEYAVTNPKTGKIEYHWENETGNFHRTGVRYRVGQVVPVSEIGGKQVEHPISIFQGLTGDWWVVYEGEFLGYFEGSLFKSLGSLNGHACRASWYGEVYRGTSTASPDGPATEMGSGQFINTADKSDAYVRNPMVYDTFWIGKPASEFGPPSLRNFDEQLLCYTRTNFGAGKTQFFLGGPGITHNNAACVWP